MVDKQKQQRYYRISESDVAKLEYHSPYGWGADIAKRCRSDPINSVSESSSPRSCHSGNQALGDLVYSSMPWKIYRQDVGMEEHEYAIFLNDTFFARTDYSQTAHEIIEAIKRRGGQ